MTLGDETMAQVGTGQNEGRIWISWRRGGTVYTVAQNITPGDVASFDEIARLATIVDQRAAGEPVLTSRVDARLVMVEWPARWCAWAGPALGSMPVTLAAARGGEHGRGQAVLRQRLAGTTRETDPGDVLMGFVRALVVILLIAVAASPLVSGRLGASTDVPAVYASSDAFGVRGDKQREGQGKEGPEQPRPMRTPGATASRPTKRRRTTRSRSRRTTTRRATTPMPSRGTTTSWRGTSSGSTAMSSRRRSSSRRLMARRRLYQGPRESARNNRSDRLYCGDLIAGDYVFVHEAQKRTEQAYDAYYISCQQEREEGPDNSNDNSDDVDPNCVHIFGRSATPAFTRVETRPGRSRDHLRSRGGASRRSARRTGPVGLQSMVIGTSASGRRTRLSRERQAGPRLPLARCP